VKWRSAFRGFRRCRSILATTVASGTSTAAGIGTSTNGHRNGPTCAPNPGGISRKSVSYIIGAPGFEPGTSCSRSRRANRAALRPANACSVPRAAMALAGRRGRSLPSRSLRAGAVIGTNGPRGIRTLNLLIRSQMLYPVELWTLQPRAGNAFNHFPALESTVFLGHLQGLIQHSSRFHGTGE
jgi:hypothetical protein